jgi:hypothetical protein
MNRPKPMKTAYSDQYGVMIWLPILIGLLSLGIAYFDQSISAGRLIFIVSAFLLAGYNWKRRVIRQKEFGNEQ